FHCWISRCSCGSAHAHNSVAGPIRAWTTDRLGVHPRTDPGVLRPCAQLRTSIRPLSSLVYGYRLTELNRAASSESARFLDCGSCHLSDHCHSLLGVVLQGAIAVPHYSTPK